MKYIIIIILLGSSTFLTAQDLTKGLIVNDLDPHPMQALSKPAYLATVVDPSFGTTIRRISNAADGNFIVPMYSTVQAWNADESLMILYQGGGTGHILLDGMSYNFIRNLDDINPTDLEDIFWHFYDPDKFFYVDNSTNELIEYHVSTQLKNVLVDLGNISSCPNVAIGNDVQMMSWDSNIITFRCGNTVCYSYNIASEELTSFNITDLAWTAPNPSPSGTKFTHRDDVYDAEGNYLSTMNVATGSEHSCIGKLANGNDAYFAISFAQGPNGGCLSTVNAHDISTGVCTPLLPDSDYGYPQSGTHISALAHNNTEGGWLTASMMGYDRDGQDLLDQEIIIAYADPDNIKICRIAHHRSDEDQFDYWGEPHAVISPKGTRVLFASDWSGSEDGISVDSYVVELEGFTQIDFGISMASSTTQTNGSTTINVVLSAIELGGISASTNEIKLSLSKDNKMMLNFDTSLTSMLGNDLENSNWTYDASDLNYHIWTSNVPIAAGNTSQIGFTIVHNPLKTDGITNLTAHIKDVENEELNILNNQTSTTINYTHE